MPGGVDLDGPLPGCAPQLVFVAELEARLSNNVVELIPLAAQRFVLAVVYPTHVTENSGHQPCSWIAARWPRLDVDRWNARSAFSYLQRRHLIDVRLDRDRGIGAVLLYRLIHCLLNLHGRYTNISLQRVVNILRMVFGQERRGHHGREDGDVLHQRLASAVEDQATGGRAGDDLDEVVLRKQLISTAVRDLNMRELQAQYGEDQHDDDSQRCQPPKQRSVRFQ